jgi:tetratricopeptide (TPR) repeat protein
MVTDRTTEVAKVLHSEGRTAEAEILYRELLSKQPDALGALEGLGVVFFQQGRTKEAAALFARGAAIDPESARFHGNLGEALRTMRQYDQALLHLRKAAALDPTDVQAWNSLGLLSFDLGRNRAAEHAYRQAIRLRPRFVHAHINLGTTLLALGRPREAVESLREAIRIDPNNALALMNLGRILSEMRDPGLYAEAEELGRRAIALAPKLTVAWATLGTILRIQGRIDEAIDCEQRASKPIPGRQAGPATDQDDPVRDGARGDATALPDSSQAWAQHMQGLTHLAESRLDEAEAPLREAIRLDPALASSWVALAGIEAERGDFEASCQSARNALTIRPDMAEAYWRLATTLLGRLPDAEVQSMERLLPDQTLSNDDRALLHFGLAAVMDCRGLYSQAAMHTEAANLHQSAAKSARGLSYDPDQHARFIDQIIACFSPDFLARGTGWGSSDPRPIFVVGFPRSGTTLTEQILASHPQIHGAGELHDLHRIFHELPELVGLLSSDPFDALRLLGPTAAQAAAQRYRDRLEALAPTTADRVVDKMPENINHLGLIALLFPRAKVVICRRDPRDIAVSCWQTGFRAGLWNNDWDHVARRLADYRRVVFHWKEVQPIPWLDLPYENLVADVEHHARLLIDFVGLEWHPACLDFHSNRRVVRTPSHAQVRHPIHSRSVARWRHYEESLQPLFRAFERHGVDWKSFD